MLNAEKTMLCDAATAALPPGHTCDPTEAPYGFIAEVKPSAASRGNVCAQCDWRRECQDPKTNLLQYGHRCMSVAVVASADGQTYRRRDRCGVIFKRRVTTPG